MNQTPDDPFARLLDWTVGPVCDIGQFAWADPDDDGVGRLWGGESPVYFLRFEADRGGRWPERVVALWAGDAGLRAGTFAGPDPLTAAEAFAVAMQHDDAERPHPAATFTLDAVVCPVPDAPDLRFWRTSVIRGVRSGAVLGVSFGLNLGVRLGLFVPDRQGSSLVWNEQCDAVTAQARTAETAGRVRIETADRPEHRPHKVVDDVDWFGGLD